jgi:hypothetical protein
VNERTSAGQVAGGDPAAEPDDDLAMAPATSPPMADLAAPPPIADPMIPPAGEPAAVVERGGPAAPVASPLPPFETVLPTLAPPQAAHLDHALPDEAAPGHIRVECPNCGSVWQGNDLRPHSEWFCGTCDFPLFWARSGAPSAVEVDAAFARLPGTDGRDAVLSLACPVCGEHNPPVPTANCLRCGSPLTTPVPVIALPAPTPAPIVVVAEPVRRRRIWPWVVATCVLAAALIVAIVIAVHRG